MAAPERRSAAAWLLAAAALTACASNGKSSPQKTPALPPQTVVPSPSANAPSESSPAAIEPQPAAGGSHRATRGAGGGDPTLVWIEPASSVDSGEPTSLAAAAARERERRQREGQPSLVINNKNLADYAAGGVLTIAQDDPSKATGAPSTAQEEASAAAGEAYWRQRGLEIRKRWREAVDSIPVLQGKAEALRLRFYSTDDPALRDGQVKPEWDRALADLEQARYKAAQGAEEVGSFLEEGRRAGALPGWLREGAELEPEPVLETTDGLLPLNEPQEPEVYSEPPVEPPPASRRR